MPITQEIVAQHNLSAEEYQKIVSLLGREPSLTELGMFSVMWSEHCSYKSSRVFLKRLPTDGPQVVQGPGENAGVVDIGDGLVAVFKMESHNHPSFIEPYQGAATGVGGILRDVFTMGARPIALLDSLRFGGLDKVKNRFLLTGVVSGIAGYGNCLSGNEYIVVRSNGVMRIETFASLARQVFDQDEWGPKDMAQQFLDVLSVDPILQEPLWVRVLKLDKLKAPRLLRIKTTMGRELRATPDHPCVIVRDGEFLTVPASELRKGCLLPILRSLPEEQPLKEIDLIERFRLSTANIYVRLSKDLEIPSHSLKNLVKHPSRRFCYRKKLCLPLKLFLAIEPELHVPRRNVQLYIPSGKANYIPAVLPISKEFARLIGYYLSEGCISKNGMTYKLIWTFGKHEHEYIADVCGILSSLNIRYALYQRQSTVAIIITSWFLGVLLKDVWKTGCSAREKCIPGFLLSSPRELKIELLKGLVRGDGSASFYPTGSRVKVRYATTSQLLFHQVVLLFQAIGLLPYTYSSIQKDSEIGGRTLRSSGKTFHLEFNNFDDIGQLTDWFTSNTNLRIRQALNEYAFNGQRSSNPRSKRHTHFSTVAIREIEAENGEATVYDLEVDPPHLFVTTSGIVTHNCVGVPTVGGELYVNDIYNKNPLVNVMCVGIAPRHRIFRGRAAGEGNPVLYIGAKTGRDGIHGATMASDSFDEASEAKRPTVQVGDPFTEKLLIECCLALMDRDLLVGIQDMGAAGLTSSSCEMASRGGTGIELEVADVPRRETGMTPYEVLLSESQERMLLVAKPGREGEVLEICKRWDLSAAVVGRVTNDGMLRVKDKGVVVAEVPARALADDAPKYERPVKAPAYQEHLESLPLECIPEPDDCNIVLETVLASPTIAHKGWVFEQYDHMVQTNTMIRPGSDAAVLRIKGTDKALALTTDGNSLYCLLNPYTGAAIAVAEASRNLACVGARPVGVTDCLNFGNPERPDIMWQFGLAVEGIADACRALKIPVVSGNVSFYNETNGLSIYPTPVIGMVGVIDRAERAITAGFKAEGDIVLLLGETGEDLGGTEYLRLIHHREQGTPPTLKFDREAAIQALVRKLIDESLLCSAHDCSEGGLAVAVAESALSAPNQPFGVELTMDQGELRRDSVLFGESQSRVLVSVKPEDEESVSRFADEAGVRYTRLGRIGGDRLIIKIRDNRGRTATWIDRDCKSLNEVWRGSLKRLLSASDETP